MYPFNQPYSPEFMRRRPESDPESDDSAAESDPNNPNIVAANTPNADGKAQNTPDADPTALPETSPSQNQSETLAAAPEFQDHMSELAGKELPMVHLDQKIAIEPTFDVPDEKLEDGDEVVARGTDSALIRDPAKGNTKILSNYLDDRLWSNEALAGHNQAMTDLHALCLDAAIVDLNSQDRGKLDDAVQKYHQLLEYRDQASPSEQVGINICLGRLMEQGPAFQLIALAGAPKEETPSTEAEAEQIVEVPESPESPEAPEAEQSPEAPESSESPEAPETDPAPESPEAEAAQAVESPESEPLSPAELENIREQRQQFVAQLEDLSRQQQTIAHIMSELKLGGRAVDVDALSESIAAARANLNTLEQDNQALKQQVDTLVDDTIDSLLDYNEAEVEKLVANVPELDELMLFSMQATIDKPKWIEARRQQVQQFERQLTEFKERMDSIHSRF